MIKGVVFDLDHTLFDRYATLQAISGHFCRDHVDCLADGLTPDEVAGRIIAADRRFIHFGWPRVHAHLAENGLFKKPLSAQAYMRYMLGKFTEIAIPFDFTIPMLLELRRLGCQIGLITNGQAEIQRAKLKLLGLSGYFDQIIICGEFGADKPDTAPFLAMAEALPAKPAELLYVGDHPLNDVDASRKAGYIPVWVRTTGSWVMPEITQPPLAVDTVAEIPDLLKRLA